MKINHFLLLGVAAVAAAPSTTTPAGAANKEIPKDIIAVQIRKQGFECKNPETATRDNPDSKADEAAWILKCEGVTYRVQLVPNMAAKVEKLKEQHEQEQPPQNDKKPAETP